MIATKTTVHRKTGTHTPPYVSTKILTFDLENFSEMAPPLKSFFGRNFFSNKLNEKNHNYHRLMLQCSSVSSAFSPLRWLCSSSSAVHLSQMIHAIKEIIPDYLKLSFDRLEFGMLESNSICQVEVRSKCVPNSALFQNELRHFLIISPHNIATCPTCSSQSTI